MSRRREEGPAPIVPGPPRHGVVDDAFGVLTGTFVASLGLFLLRASGAVTGGSAGLALLVSYASGRPLGAVLLVITVPFLLLALWTRGLTFTLRTAVCIVLVAGFSALHPLLARVQLEPVYAVLTGNLLIGIGLLILFRHRASLGGLTVLALLLQERFGGRAGAWQLALDTVVIASALLVVPAPRVLLSVAGAVVLNAVLIINHRPGRYLGT